MAPATPDPKGQTLHRWPWFLPDGHHFLYLETTGTSVHKIRAGSIEGLPAKGRPVTDSSSNAIYSQGCILFLKEGTLMGLPFQPGSLTAAGNAVPFVEDVSWSRRGAAGAFAVSANGLLVYEGGGERSRRPLAWFDRQGKSLSNAGEPGDLGPFSLSPDGKNVALTVSDGANHSDVWILELARGIRSRFTFDAGASSHPIWSPDGNAIVYRSTRGGQTGLSRKAADGSGTEELLYADGQENQATDFSPDGKYVVYHNNAGVWLLPADGGGKPVLFAPHAVQARFSPDGRWIAYASDESGRTEIYLTPYPGPGARRQVSTNGAGGIPNWRHDGGAIFYIASNRDLTEVEVKAKGSGLEFSAPVKLFGPIYAVGGHDYDVAADGRILTFAASDKPADESLTLVSNWLSLIRKP